MRFLLAARKRGANFGEVLMIRRHNLNGNPAKIRAVLAEAGLPNEFFAPDAPDTGFTEPVFKSLDAGSIWSLDASAFEGAEPSYPAFADNGFEAKRVVIHVVGPYNRWYEVTNPRAIRSRIKLMNCFPLQLLVQARRTRRIPPFAKTSQQSDYEVSWAELSPNQPNPFMPMRPKLAKILPGMARLSPVAKIGWQFWHNYSLRNRKDLRPVQKSRSKSSS